MQTTLPTEKDSVRIPGRAGGGRGACGVFSSLLALFVATIVFGLYGFGGPLYRDYGIYFYGGQQMVSGLPPYVSIFDHKGPLPAMVSAAGVLLSRLLGTGDVLGARLVFYSVACLAALAVYLLGRDAFRSRLAGLLGTLTFVGFFGFARPAASGPEPKTPMVLFEVLALWLAVRKRWFWSGACGSVAFLAWQPMAVLGLSTLLLALFQPAGERLSATLRAALGAATPLVVVVAYYAYNNAIGDLIDGVAVFNLRYVHRGGPLPLMNPGGPERQILEGYPASLVPIVVGLVVILSLYLLAPRRYVALLLPLPLLVSWSLLDFQVPEDFYPFLPYAAVGFGAFAALGARSTGRPALAGGAIGLILLGVALVGTPFFNPDASPPPTLAYQERSIQKIEDRLGPDARILSINTPQAMALLHRTNENRYLFVNAGIDRLIQAREPGGFEGWVRSLKTYDPDAVIVAAEGQRLAFDGELTPEHRRELDSWLSRNYYPQRVGAFGLYVRKDASDTSSSGARFRTRSCAGRL